MDTNTSIADRIAPAQPTHLDDDDLAAIRERDIITYRSDVELGGGLLTRGAIDRHLLLDELARLHAVLVRQGLVISRFASQPALVSAVITAAAELVGDRNPPLPANATPNVADLAPLRTAVVELLASLESNGPSR